MKKYKLKKDIGKLKKGTVLELKGTLYVSGTSSFDAFYVWDSKEFFRKVE